MEGNSQFDRNAEERSMAYFSFSIKVFHWCRIFLIPVAVLYLAMMIYGHRLGVSSAGGVLFLLCIVVYLVILSKQERAYTQYAREARAVIEQNSTEPYSRKAMELRDALQKTGKSVYYLIAGMILFLGLLCLAGGLAIMWMGGSLLFWGSPILLLAIPCFLLGIFYIQMGKSTPRSYK